MATPMRSISNYELPSRLLWGRAGRVLICVLAVVLLMLLLPMAVHAGDKRQDLSLADGAAISRA